MKKLLALFAVAVAGCASNSDTAAETKQSQASDSEPFTVTTKTSGFDNQVTTQFIPKQEKPITLEPKSDDLAVDILFERISVRDGTVADVEVKREGERGMLTMVVTTSTGEEYPFSTLGAVDSLSAEGEGFSTQLFRMDCETLVKYANTKDQQYEIRITATNGFTDYIVTREAGRLFKAASEACEQK